MAAGCAKSRAPSTGGTPPPPTQPIEPTLSFVGLPQGGTAGTPLPEFRVTGLAPQRNSPAAGGDVVRIGLLSIGNGAQIDGTLRVPEVLGVATFSDVRIDRGGSYRLIASAEGYESAISGPIVIQTAPLHLILMIADGWGYKQVEATRLYTGRDPYGAPFVSHSMATFDVTTLVLHQGVGYNSARAWSSFDYPMVAATDSAASATAMYTGEKTYNGRVGTSITRGRLQALPEMASLQGLAFGAVTSVPLPHATPAAWLAHNDYRGNYYALADEMLWGDPNTTGTIANDARYGGSLGVSTLVPSVIIAGGHPGWTAEEFMRVAQRDKLANESGQPGAWRFVERIRGQQDGGARLLSAANNPGVQRLCGLFGGGGGNIEFRRADGTGASRENPTLVEMTNAALAVLQRRSTGCVLMIEGGAIDFAGHFNQLDSSIGEMIDFENAVRAVVTWVDSPSTVADWTNTLLIVTGDHECGYLTADRRVFANAPLGEVSPRTLALERVVQSTGRRASWEDINSNCEIDVGEVVYWVWHTAAHSNSLIPLYVRGIGASRFDTKFVATDPVRGQYIDNTAVYQVMRDVLQAPR